ncbi:hypothetical protein [Alkaliphilus serpentinus]|uniref:Uncharacterized protein n=1 Tax=Alkaliphilus serpentinus TaxID=1482731 RepID=A0A833MDU5_9FIRM|nr:hypothetical protein [Alkaliphilus serpentinus]KAB3529589.1 hypothetical protein F8153_09040 [Alkaliphilus serpentinus]
MSTTPKRKRLKRKNRLQVAKKWIPTYNGKNLVKGYRRWFGVSLLCAIKEIEILGYKVDAEYKKQIIELEKMKQKKAEKKRKMEKEQRNSEEYYDSDETYYFIAGYTSGGVPYGVTWEQYNNETQCEKRGEKERSSEYLGDTKSDDHIDLFSDDIPF